jgi:hypothetical protein
MPRRVVLAALCFSALACGRTQVDSTVPSITNFLTPSELTAVLKERPHETTVDSASSLAEAAYWQWEGQGDPQYAVRLYCAAITFGVPTPGFYKVGRLALQSLSEFEAEVELMSAAVKRWPTEPWSWSGLVTALRDAGRAAEADSIDRGRGLGRVPPLPALSPKGCQRAALRRPVPGAT